MGTRQLRLAPTETALRPVVGRPAQVVLTDGEVLHGTLTQVAPAGLFLQPGSRFPARAVPLARVREVFADADANH